MNYNLSDLVTSDLEQLFRLRKRAMRANIWSKVENCHRATIGVMHWIWNRGVTDLLDRAIRNIKVRSMVGSAVTRIVDLLSCQPWTLPARIRCLVTGMKISKTKIASYREKGVFSWVPWLQEWLEEPETLFFFGATTKRWAIG